MNDVLLSDIQLYDDICSRINYRDHPTSAGFFYDLYFIDEFVKFINCDVYYPSYLNNMKRLAETIASEITSTIRHKAREIFLNRNGKRGGLWKDVGAVGASIEIHAKMARLKMSRGEDEDSLLDLYNYLIIFLMSVESNLIKVTGGQSFGNAVVTGDHEGGLGQTIAKLLTINNFNVLPYGKRTSHDEIVDFFMAVHCNIDILINNFGINKLNWIGQIQQEDYKVIDYNLKLPMMVVNELVREGHSKTIIINICSQTYRVAQRCTSLYCASKAGLAHMTKVMARELAPKGYIVNALAPGKIIDTKMTTLTDNQVLQLRRWSGKQADAYAQQLIPAGRYTSREEVAIAVLKILSLPEYINGCIIDMTGGQ